MTANINHAVFNLHAWCWVGVAGSSVHHCTAYCDAEEDVTNNGYYLQHFIWRLPRLETCKINLTIPRVAEDEGLWPGIKHADPLVEAIKELASMSEVTAIRVYKDYGPKHMLWGCWSKAKGWHAPTEAEYDEEE